MLAKPVEALPPARALPGGCLYEPKWDGYRALIRVDADGARIRSRRGVDLTPGFPDVAAAAAGQFHPGTLLDGELVSWNPDTHALDFAALQRRLTLLTARRPDRASSRARSLAAEQPASFVIFDLLVDAGVPRHRQPLRERRRALERLVPLLHPPLQVTPATRDHDVAAVWLRDYADADVGIEGLVIKGLAQPYRPGARAWLKLRTRSTAEAIVGAVTGTLAHPERLILGFPSATAAAGELLIAGSTTPLTPTQQRLVAAHLRPPVGPHSWPSELPSGRLGHFGTARRRLPVRLVDPTLVVEVHADTAFEHGRWRHPTRFVRVRPELHPDDVSPPSDGA
jgi:ATP-dependent DNA ligase